MIHVNPGPGCVISRRRAFTLVELLVVIGIIGLLIGILLPSLRKAKEAAAQAKCMSNMRQIALAIIAYTNDNKGSTPAAGGSGPALLVAGDPTTSYDWIAWQRKLDPTSGKRYLNMLDQNITYSATAKYMGAKLINHNPNNGTTNGDYGRANEVAQTLDQVYRCPSDFLESRPSGLPQDPATKLLNRYSYAMNKWMAP